MPEIPAVVWHGAGDVRAQTWFLPGPVAPGWLRVRVTWCGLCGSDVTEVVRGPVVLPSTPHPVSGRTVPLVLGHELAGTIVRAGAGGDVLADGTPALAGQRIVSDSLAGCDRCRACASGEPNRCGRLVAVGQQTDGGLAEFVDVPAASCRPVPPDLPLDVAVLAEPLAVGVRALRRGGWPLDGPTGAGRPVVILGAGPVGLLIAMLVRGSGPAVIVDPVPARRDRAAALAGIQTRPSLDGLDPDGPPWLVVECTGDRAALTAAISGMPTGSRLVVVGVHDAPAPLDLWRTVHKELTLIGSLSHDRSDFAAALDRLAADPVGYAGLISHRTNLAGAVPALHALARPAAAPAGKVLVGPEGDPWTTPIS